MNENQKTANSSLRTTFKEKMKIIDFVRSRLEHYAANRTSRNETVEDVNKNTGVEITKPALIALLKEADLTWTRRPDRPKKHSAGRGAVRLRRISQIERGILVLAQSIEKLMIDLGQPVPRELKELLDPDTVPEEKSPANPPETNPVPAHLPRSARGNIVPAH